MISDRYLLVLNIPLRRHGGRLWADALWHKDLSLHLDYIKQMTLVCPVEDLVPSSNYVACDFPTLTVIPVPAMSRRSFFKFPALMAVLSKTIRVNDIIHTGVIGWPFPLGWIASYYAYRYRKTLLIVVESATWRYDIAAKSLMRPLISAVYECISKLCLRKAVAVFYSTSAYERELGRGHQAISRVVPCSWVDKEEILQPLEIAEIWSRKPRKVLFSGRLIELKGIRYLLEASHLTDVAIDIIGEGELFNQCQEYQNRYPDKIKVLPYMIYDESYRKLFDDYIAVVVPTISDEQPRVIFDAYARGVPVIATNTPGHVDIVEDGVTGWLIEPANAHALANAISCAARDLTTTQSMGASAAAFCVKHTHQGMHESRIADLKLALSPKETSRPQLHKGLREIGPQARARRAGAMARISADTV